MKNSYMKVLGTADSWETHSPEVKVFINGTPYELYAIEQTLERIEKLLEKINDSLK